MGDEKKSGINKREHYRVVYPVKARPVLRIGEDEFRVIDLSSKGIRFLNHVGRKMEVGSIVDGTITFHNNASEALWGEVLRISGDEVVIYLRSEVSFAKMIEEERKLRTEYKHLT